MTTNPAPCKRCRHSFDNHGAGGVGNLFDGRVACTKCECPDYAEPHNAAEALAVVVEALEAAEEKFQRIQNVAMPNTMVMARAVDGENEARSALDRIEKMGE